MGLGDCVNVCVSMHVCVCVFICDCAQAQKPNICNNDASLNKSIHTHTHSMHIIKMMSHIASTS